MITTLKRVCATGLAALGLCASSVFLSTGVAHAGRCDDDPGAVFGGGVGPFGANGGAFVDCHFAQDGSHDHCQVVKVMGIQVGGCSRVGP